MAEEMIADTRLRGLQFWEAMAEILAAWGTFATGDPAGDSTFDTRDRDARLAVERMKDLAQPRVLFGEKRYQPTSGDDSIPRPVQARPNAYSGQPHECVAVACFTCCSGQRSKLGSFLAKMPSRRDEQPIGQSPRHANWEIQEENRHGIAHQGLDVCDRSDDAAVHGGGG
jgi:hypothetical protein